MGLHIINRSTRTKQGGGLPFYKDLAYIFSALNNGVMGVDGLWKVPIDRSISFQIISESNTFNDLLYLETKGNNEFTGLVYNAGVVLNSPIVPIPIQVDGVQKYVYEVSDSTYTGTLPVAGRYVARLNLGGSSRILHSEEFLITDCA